MLVQAKYNVILALLIARKTYMKMILRSPHLPPIGGHDLSATIEMVTQTEINFDLSYSLLVTDLSSFYW